MDLASKKCHNPRSLFFWNELEPWEGCSGLNSEKLDWRSSTRSFTFNGVGLREYVAPGSWGTCADCRRTPRRRSRWGNRSRNQRRTRGDHEKSGRLVHRPRRRRLGSGRLIAGHYICGSYNPTTAATTATTATASSAAAAAAASVRQKLVLRGVHFDFNKSRIRPGDAALSSMRLRLHSEGPIRTDDQRQRLLRRYRRHGIQPASCPIGVRTPSSITW